MLISGLFFLIIFRCAQMTYQGNLLWVINRKGALVKICLSMLIIFDAGPAIGLFAILIDCMILPHKYKVDFFLRVFTGLLLMFLSNNLLPFVFLINTITVIDSSRLFAGDPQQVAKASLTMVKFYQDLPPGGKFSFGASTLIVVGTLSLTKLS